jgi:membrane-associated protein
MDFIHSLSGDGLKHLIETGGLLLIIGIIFAETGLFIGFFLPGDSLLILAGVACQVDLLQPEKAEPLFSYPTMVSLAILAAIAGNMVNGACGRLAGARARGWPDGRFYKRRYLAEAEDFYRRWGAVALIIGRFIPIVRTFVPFAAGMAGMGWSPMILWSVLGAIGWVGGMTGIGFALAHNEPLMKNLHAILLGVIAVSLLPVAIGVIKRWRSGPPPAGDGSAPGKPG